MSTALSKDSTFTRRALTGEELRFALQRERSRTERTGVPTSFLRVQVESASPGCSSFSEVGDWLLKRVRITDDVGEYKPRQLGVILAGTTEENAWKFADSLRDEFSHRYALSTEVFAFPGSWLDDSESVETDLLRTQPLNVLFAEKQSRGRRFIDVSVALLSLGMLLPLLLLIAVSVKLSSPGPLLFRQRRSGLLGRSFTIYKFRTMRADAELQQAELKSLSMCVAGPILSHSCSCSMRPTTIWHVLNARLRSCPLKGWLCSTIH